MRTFLFAICVVSLFSACTRRICPAYGYQSPAQEGTITVPEAPVFDI